MGRVHRPISRKKRVYSAERAHLVHCLFASTYYVVDLNERWVVTSWCCVDADRWTRTPWANGNQRRWRVTCGDILDERRVRFERWSRLGSSVASGRRPTSGKNGGEDSLMPRRVQGRKMDRSGDGRWPGGCVGCEHLPTSFCAPAPPRRPCGRFLAGLGPARLRVEELHSHRVGYCKTQTGTKG